MNSTTTDKLLTRTGAATPQAIALLERLVNMDSPAADSRLTRDVQVVLEAELATLGFASQWHDVDTDSARAVLEANLSGYGGSRIALLGHVDTVFPVGTAQARPYHVNDSRAHGPGVSDMKGGLALMWNALAGITHSLAAEERPNIRVILTCDEEIGTPYSKGVLQAVLKDCDAVLNFEPGRPDGSVVTSRRGSAHLSLNVTGKSAHSGADFSSGRSAIVSLAQIITALHALNENTKGASVNIGILEGGTATNVVADSAKATVHLAYESTPDGYQLLESARTITQENCLSGTRAELLGELSFLPMPETAGNQRFFELYEGCSKLVNAEVRAVHAMGASDAGIPASMGIPTLCGVGPTGGNWHSEDEYLELSDFGRRAQIAALTIARSVRSSSSLV